jgi:type IV secretory pathway TrbF-like protein
MGTDAHNPYLAARLAWNERYMALARSIRNWQLIAGGLLLTTCGLSAGLVYVSSQQQVQPYVVEVDAAGVAKAVADLRPHAVLDPLVVGAQLRRFILDLRSVSLDEAATRRQINAAYQQCLQEAQHWIAGQYRGRSLADLMAKGRIFPVNIVLAPITPKTWRARWKEQTIGHDGTLVDESEYEATIEVALIQPTSREDRDKSPLGIWITSVHWQQL